MLSKFVSEAVAAICDTKLKSSDSCGSGAKMGVKSTSEKNGSTFCCADRMERRVMGLPFQPLSLAFNHVNYFIDVPGEMKARGVKDDRLQLLKDVSGAFRPGILTALTGVSGAGKTTLMDVLAGQKTGGYIEGSIFLSDFPKNQATFARVSGYCEQNDIHTPNVTVHESLLYSAWLRLSSDERGNQELIREIITPLTGSKDLVFRTKYAQPFLVQFKACLWKQHWSYWRNLQYNVTRFVITVLTATIFGVVFFNKGEKIEKLQDLVSMLGAFHSAVVFLGAINQNGVQPIVAVERTVFYRERAAGMYSSLPYALAQVTIESIYIACQTCIYVCLLYPTIGFQWTTAKFLWFYYYMLTSIIYFTMFGMMIISLTPSPQISAVIIYFFICLWNLFSGFIIPRPHIPIWSRWYYWGNPLSWTIYGLLTSQVGQQDLMFEVPGAGNVTAEGFMKKEFGFEYDFLPVPGPALFSLVSRACFY